MSSKDNLKQLNRLFGSYRAEWLREKVFDYFAEPSYFTALQDNRPCVLEGGRGSGKTTVLRGLSYQGQYALHKRDVVGFDSTDYIGIYHRVDTNHVRAFVGGGISDDDWNKYFVHYFNLVMCREILCFIKWHKQISPEDEGLCSHSCNLIAKSLHIVSGCDDLDCLLDCLDLAMYEFQASINNIGDEKEVGLSMAGDPIKLATEHAISLRQFSGKTFFFLLDEYENYTDCQQQLVNTLIKHSTSFYTFKIGVRELGWRIKHTLNPNELLHDPADYVLINIERKLTDESHFVEFAKNVCQQRIEQIIQDESQKNAFDIESSLASLTVEQEADELGVMGSSYWAEVKKLPKKSRDLLGGRSNLFAFFLSYWSRFHGQCLTDIVGEYSQHPGTWNTRYENYKYEMLFKIRKGRGSVGVQKYYAGWSTYTKLAAGNIRYLMELVYRAYEKHLLSNDDICGVVCVRDQTLAAQEVGKKNLRELEGLWKNGAQLTKLILGVGRVFQVLARDEGKHAPEVNQFSIENSASLSDQCKELLAAAVMHLAFVRSPGNKLDSISHTRDYLYSIHPIYSPFLVFSYRKKRKLILSENEFLGMIETPRATITSVLSKRNVTADLESDLPEQMDLFAGFYDA